MEDTGPFHDLEVVHQGSIGSHCLSAYARTAFLQVGFLNGGYESLKRPAEELLAERPPNLLPRHVPVAAQERPEPPVAKGVCPGPQR
jgi:hypothetical protein